MGLVGMSQVVPSLLKDCRDWDSRGSNLWDLMGCPK